ncbi:hypothetical protein [Arsenophonus sp. ENCA]|uniref:hypothetical protein n=1 Tax=Arsenophonus sp. ENCA TaxID=1987579 RepID=UPI0025C4AE86|nr:hypothetical protein [Arsenophonus sp. ENCA]
MADSGNANDDFSTLLQHSFVFDHQKKVSLTVSKKKNRLAGWEGYGDSFWLCIRPSQGGLRRINIGGILLLMSAAFHALTRIINMFYLLLTCFMSFTQSL